MAKIKIFLEEGEEDHLVEEQIIKAIKTKNDKQASLKRYDDPIFNDLLKEMDEVFAKEVKKMVSGVLEILKSK